MISVTKLQSMKNTKKIVMLTAYDSITASIAARSGVDMILVGDSLANTALGYPHTLKADMETMLHHTRAVCRSSGDCFVVFDMPFLSCSVSERDAILNCGRALHETGAGAVKIEGGSEIVPLVKKLTAAGIPVIGHLGLQPQKFLQYGGYPVQGRDDESASKIQDAAAALTDAGIIALVLECVPEKLAQRVTADIPVPVIGIGAGRFCDGQVQVIADLLGMMDGPVPRHAKKYAELADLAVEAVTGYISDVRNGVFPNETNTFQ